MKTVKYFRHGDMCLAKIDTNEVKSNLKEKNRKSLTVGVGEVSGHNHMIRPLEGSTIVEFAEENSEVLESEDTAYVDRDEILFEVRGKGAVITHQEHGPITLEPGIYKRYNQVSYNPFEGALQKVRD
jgi:hypothetical protein